MVDRNTVSDKTAEQIGLTDREIMEHFELSNGSRRLPGVLDEKFGGKHDASVILVIEFEDRIYGGLPMSGKPLEYFIKLKKMSDAEAEDLRKRIKDGVLSKDEIEEIDETCVTVFERDIFGFLCVWHGNIKAMMREVLSTSGVFIKKKSKQGKNVFQHRTWIEPIRPRFIREGPDGKLYRIKTGDGMERPPEGAAIPDPKPELGTVEKIKIIRDAQGQRTALGRHEYLQHCRLALSWNFGFDNPAYTAEDFEAAWYKAQTNGLGACRSQGQGRFKVIGWKWVKKPPTKKEKADEAATKVKSAEK